MSYLEPVYEAISNVVTIIEGDCSGICIHLRADYDPHLMFTILGEDDGAYFVAADPCWSTAWMKDVRSSIAMAEAWLEINAEKDDFGWRIKK